MIRLILGEGVYQSVPKKVPLIPDNAEILSRVIDELLTVCKAHNAVGLSAPQIGHNLQIFTIKDTIDYSIFINPRIVHESDELAQATETDLSFPGLAVKINRPYTIRVRYQNVFGETKTANLEGGPARLFQHEMSHMMCIPFWESANFLNRSKAIKDWKQIKRRLNNLPTSALPL